LSIKCAPRGRRIIDDDIGLPAYIDFEFTWKTRHFQRYRRLVENLYIESADRIVAPADTIASLDHGNES
jgi:hypothetical protein